MSKFLSTIEKNEYYHLIYFVAYLKRNLKDIIYNQPLFNLRGNVSQLSSLCIRNFRGHKTLIDCPNIQNY